MDYRLDFNRIAAIAVDVEKLALDRSAPVATEGDIIVERPDGSGIDFLDMDKGEAARRVVEAVLSSRHVDELFAERDLLWDALRWMLSRNQGSIELTPKIDHTLNMVALTLEEDSF